MRKFLLFVLMLFVSVTITFAVIPEDRTVEIVEPTVVVDYGINIVEDTTLGQNESMYVLSSFWTATFFAMQPGTNYRNRWLSILYVPRSDNVATMSQRRHIAYAYGCAP